VSDPRIDITILAARRADAMLPALQRELARGILRRRALSRAIGACAIVLLLGGGIVAAMLTTGRSGAPTLPTPLAGATLAPAEQTAVRIEIVRSMDASSIEIVRDSPRETIIAMHTNPSVDLASISVTDHELLDLLNEIGRPTGLVRANGRVWLTAAVTDDEIAARRVR
jgi:hypothetical protein